MQRADSENALYLEPMLFSNSTAGNAGSAVWPGGTLNAADLPAFHTDLLAYGGWNAAVQAIITDIKNTEAGARQTLGCAGGSPASACRVGSLV